MKTSGTYSLPVVEQVSLETGLPFPRTRVGDDDSGDDDAAADGGDGRGDKKKEKDDGLGGQELYDEFLRELYDESEDVHSPLGGGTRRLGQSASATPVASPVLSTATLGEDGEGGAVAPGTHTCIVGWLRYRDVVAYILREFAGSTVPQEVYAALVGKPKHAQEDESESPVPRQSFVEFLQEHVSDVTVGDLDPSPVDYIPVFKGTSVAKIVQIFSTGMHRVVLIDEMGAPWRVCRPRDLIQFLYGIWLSDDQSITEFGIVPFSHLLAENGTKPRVPDLPPSVTPHVSAAHALVKLADRNCEVLAMVYKATVMNKHPRVTGRFTDEDLLPSLFTRDRCSLAQPVQRYFTEYKPEALEVASVTLDHGLGDAIARMATRGTEEIFIVDDTVSNKPLGMLSFADIMHLVMDTPNPPLTLVRQAREHRSDVLAEEEALLAKVREAEARREAAKVEFAIRRNPALAAKIEAEEEERRRRKEEEEAEERRMQAEAEAAKANEDNYIADPKVGVFRFPIWFLGKQKMDSVRADREAAEAEAALRDGVVAPAIPPGAAKEEDDDAESDPFGDVDEEVEAERQAQLDFQAAYGSNIAVDLLIYLLFLSLFISMTLVSTGDFHPFYTQDRLHVPLYLREYDDGRGFYQIYRVEDVWDYLQTILIPFLLDPNYSNGQARPPDDLFFPNIHNKLLGGIRLRQVKVKPFSCDAPNEYEDSSGEQLTQCFAEYSTGDEDESSFSGTGTSGQTLTFNYTSASENDEPPWWGKFVIYGGGGYVEDLPLDLDQAQERLADLRAARWIRPGVRALIIDFQTYNAGVNLHGSFRLAVEFPHWGGLFPKSDLVAFKENRYFGSTGRTLIILECFLFLILLTYAWQEYDSLTRYGWRAHYSSIWHCIDSLNIVLFVGSLGIHIRFFVVASDHDPMDTPLTYESVRHLVALYQAENYIWACNAFLLWLKIAKYFVFSRRVQFLFRMLSIASTDLSIFFIAFVLFIIAFAHAGFLSFSLDLIEYRSFGDAMFTLFASSIGEMDYEALQSSNRVWGPIYFILFNFLMIMLLLNVFIAILMDAYAAVVEEDKDVDPEAEKEQMRKMIVQLRNKFRKIALGGTKVENESKIRRRHGLVDSDDDPDADVGEGELEQIARLDQEGEDSDGEDDEAKMEEVPDDAPRAQAGAGELLSPDRLMYWRGRVARLESLVMQYVAMRRG